MAVKPIPDEYRAATPYLCIDGAARAIVAIAQREPDAERLELGHVRARAGLPSSLGDQRNSQWAPRPRDHVHLPCLGHRV